MHVPPGPGRGNARAGGYEAVRMFPVLLDLGSFQVHSYGALGALGFVLGCGLTLWRARALGLDLNRVSDVIFWMALAGVVGGRLTYVLVNPGVARTWFDLVDVRSGGMVFYGGFLLGVPLGFALLRRHRLPILAAWDVFATGMPLGHAISRLGCFAAGCCFGTPSDAPWAVTYPPDSVIAPAGVPLHPAQLYEALGLFGITLAVNVLYPRRRFDGQVFLLYAGLYAALRPVMELFRGDGTRGWFLEGLLGQTLSLSQGLSLVVAVGCLALAARLVRDPRLTTSAR